MICGVFHSYVFRTLMLGLKIEAEMHILLWSSTRVITNFLCPEGELLYANILKINHLLSLSRDMLVFFAIVHLGKVYSD